MGCSDTEMDTPTVSIKQTTQGYRLLRNGVPFLIKGAGGDLKYLKELKEAGANTIRIYDTLHLSTKLDKISRSGLFAVIDIPVPRFDSKMDSFYTNKTKVKKLMITIKAFIERFKNHPAILYWILGNEVQYPELSGDKRFVTAFNQLVDLIHETDKNHPVSTAIAGVSRKRLISLSQRSPQLDFISINVFGQLSDLKKRTNSIALFWRGPFVISEWGINGPWEAEKTTWSAPIEQTSTKKAEQLKKRYELYIEPVIHNRCMGTLAFFWGHKQETTHTWFSIFSEQGAHTEMASTLENIWKKHPKNYTGPKLEYVLMNDQGANQSILINTEQKIEAKLIHVRQDAGNYKVVWEVVPEGWFYNKWETEKKLPRIRTHQQKNTSLWKFNAPHQQGPYRLFVTLHDSKGKIARTNIPFYVLNKEADE